MTIKHLGFIRTLLFIAILITSALARASSTPIESSLAPMLKTVMPAIVNIKAQIKITNYNVLRELEKRRAEQGDNSNQALSGIVSSVASGVIVDEKNGYILTNAHVINDAQTIIVTLSDGRHFNAKVIGIDKPSDIAVIQIKAKNLTAAKIGNSSSVKVGDFVAAIGNPFGLSQTVTSGIVSAIGRTTLGIENYENFIQTDAPINPGNSGGALINMQGELVGINTAILAPNQGSIGIGFAIPAAMATSVMNQLIRYGNVQRGVLGIGVQDVKPDLAEALQLTIAKGAAITQVLPDSPAAKAGMQVGDIITTINGITINGASDVVNTVAFLRVDSKIDIELLRQNKKITASVVLSDGKKRELALSASEPFFYGVGLKNFDQYSPIHGNVNGVLIVSVQENTNAFNSDLRPGDVITSINQQKITTIDELKAIAAKSDKSVVLNVLRGAGAMFLVITKES